MSIFSCASPWAAASDVAAGARWYAVCASCHGERAEGIPALSAPRLSRLSSDYLTRQLRSFQDGWRGGRNSDTYAQQMAAMASLLSDAHAVEDVVAFIGTLTSHSAEAAPVAGDVVRGRNVFTVCAACHGKLGEGSDALQAPGLVNQDPRYLIRQLQNFKTHERGAAAADTSGRTMAAASQVLADQKDILDVVAFIASLSGAASPAGESRTPATRIDSHPTTHES